ncbi:GNAT family N-acetyltransferase [Paenibacillus koleovorans]|uniref:GNAT family N-acetyltransferase n=1 Tax=Paenibacillus koleovorans TaxID=121608 RepID=UPI000FD81DFD|nr:GNAT family N-acetyltransferase [Paenibacillus koleovorans]
MDVRQIGSAERDEAIRLVNEVFREPDERTMEVAFARSFSMELGQSFGAFEEGKLVAFIGLVPVRIRIGAASLSAFMLGQVCTHPDFQGRGYANATMEAAISHAKRSGGSVLLVSGARGLYERHRCLRFGGSQTVKVEAEHAERLRTATDGLPALSIRVADSSDWFRLHELDRRMPVGFERSLWDLADLIASEAQASCKKMRNQVYIAESGGQIAAYAVFAVPRSGQQTGSQGSPLALVDWAGESAGAAALIAYALDRHGADACTVRLPWQETELAWRLAETGCTVEHVRMSGTLRILDAQRVAIELAPYMRDEGFEPLIPDGEYADWSVDVRVGADRFTLSSQQWIEWLFAPEDAELDLVLTALNERRRRCPVPLPMPGGLNYV